MDNLSIKNNNGSISILNNYISCNKLKIKNENGEIEKLTPSESDDKKGAYYKDVEKYEEVYVVEKELGQATQDSVITIGETKQPDNKVFIIVLSVLVILGVVCTLLIIKIKKKEGRKNEKKV